MASKGNKFILEKFISNNQLQKAQEGVETTVPTGEGKDVKVRYPDGTVKILNTASPEYVDMYNTGQIQTQEGITNDEWWGGKLEDVVIQREPTEFGKVRNQIKKQNTWEDYAQRYLGNFERRMGQTLQNLPEYRKREYEDYINKLSFDEYVKTHPQAKGEDRGAYIDRIQAENAKSPNFGRAYEANAPYNDATDINKWRKFLVGLGSIMVPKPAMDYMKQNSDYYSTKEKQEMKDSPVLTQVGDIMGTLEPLTIPVEGLYGEKSFGDIASGESADIPMSMRILGDPLMPLFEAAPLLGAGFKTIGRALGTEEGLLSNAWKYNPRADKVIPWGKTAENANKSFRVTGLNALEDFKNTGVLRSRNTEPGHLVKGTDFIMPPRSTSFPSFQKGYADLSYGKPEGSVVFETSLPTFKRGEINPVTGLPIKGRHYAHRVIDPVTGKTMTEIPAADIRVFRDKPHWLKGYQELDVAAPSTTNAAANTATDAANLNMLRPTVNNTLEPIREADTEANLIEKVENDVNFSHQDYMLNKYPDVPVTENYINLIENQELNEVSKNRITDLAEHWVYENPAQRVENQKVMEQLTPLFDKQKQEAQGVFNMSRKSKLDHVNERIKIIQNDAETIQNNIDVGANKFIEKLQNKAKDDPNFINELLEQRKQLEEAITKYGDEFFGDTKNPNFNNLTEEELNAMHLEIKAKRDGIANEIQAVRDQVVPAKLNPAFEEKIKDLHLYAEEPVPASIDDVFPVEKGMRERNRVVYPRAIPESVSDLNKYELDKLLETQKTALGVNQGSYGHTFSFGENPYSFEDLKALYDVNYEKAPFKLSEPSTWFGKKMNRVVGNKPSEFVKNIKIRDADPEKLFNTIGHEVGHDFQKFGSWGELIAKYFDNIEYYSNHGENNLSRAFKKHMVEPNGWDSSSAWRSSGNELHSDLVAEKFKIMDKLDADPKKAVEMFRANEGAFIDQIVESGVLDKFFKPDTPLNIKKELAKILPVAIPAALTVGATVGATNQNDSEEMPTQKYGGSQSYFDFEKYAMKEMGGMMYANKDAGLPHEQSMRKYLSAQNNLLDFMKRVKVVGGPVPFDEYYRENIINPRNKS
jgi:hypothetical protein